MQYLFKNFRLKTLGSRSLANPNEVSRDKKSDLGSLVFIPQQCLIQKEMMNMSDMSGPKIAQMILQG